METAPNRDGYTAHFFKKAWHIKQKECASSYSLLSPLSNFLMRLMIALSLLSLTPLIWLSLGLFPIVVLFTNETKILTNRLKACHDNLGRLDLLKLPLYMDGV